MTRTPANEGSVYQRASDGLWVAAATLPDGRRRVRYAKTEKPARAKLRELLAEIEAGRPLPAGRTPTLGQYLTRWLTVRLPQDVEAGLLAESTADQYERYIRDYVLGTPLADVRMNELAPDDVRAWQRRELKQKSRRGTPLSHRTVGLAQAVLRRAVGDAVRNNALARNVVALVALPSEQFKPVELPSEEDMAKLLAEAIEDKHRVLWLTMLAIGTRKGETLGLRWTRTDLDAGTTKVRKQIYRQRGPVNPTTGRRTGRLIERDTKTPESRATLRLPASLVAVLREHQREQKKARLAARVWIDADLVFTTRVGTPIEPRRVNRMWAEVCERAGVKMRVHDLRHAAASLAFAEGASVKEVQAMLRHAKEATTSAIYVHVLESVREGTAAKMDSALRRLGA